MFVRVLKTLIVLLMHVYAIASLAENIGLPYCPDNPGPGLLIVSTLDGKLSALNTSGSLLWQINTDPGPLLKSNIHNIELTNNGEWTRLIPSLTGSLYKFNGKTLDAIPMSAESLLKSSFYYSYDLVIAGGKEVRTYGVGLNSGNIIYSCSLLGCQNETNFEGEIDNVLIIERNTLTVRAHEPRTGSERWNFSVGYHNIKIPSISCIHTDNSFINFNVSAILPEGLLIATKMNNKNQTIWTYKFDAPIVSVWLWDGRDLTAVDLFEFPLGDKEKNDLSPAIYLAMHNKQLYIHESNRMLNLMQSNPYLNTDVIESKTITKIPWKPIPASTAMIKTSDHDVSAAHSVLYNSEYVNGNGYYLFMEKNEKENRLMCTGNTTHKKYIKYISTISLFNYMSIFTIIVIIAGSIYFFFIPQMIIVYKKQLSTSSADSNLTTTTNSTVYEEAEEKFISNYETNFQTIRLLGKGGFGKVFEAKQNIDDCSYAIKRIRCVIKSSEDQVLREVKALATLDHINIVRYYNSWFERPPNGWKYACDSILPCDNDDDDYSTSDSSSDAHPNFSKRHRRNNSTIITMPSSTSAEDSLPPRLDPEISDSDIVFTNDSKLLQDASNCPSYDCIDFTKRTSRSVSSSSRNTRGQCDSGRVYLYIQMQLCKKDSLQEWLSNNTTGKRNKAVIMPLFKQILNAVEYIHSKNLIHRDLKPSNIFFSMDNKIKVGDFGLVTTTNGNNEDYNASITSMRSHTQGAGTHLYMSPEQLLKKQYNLKVDIYSLGVIFFELLVPFTTEMERRRTLENLREHKYPAGFKDNFPDEHRLLQKMLSSNPDVRPLTTDIKKTTPLTSAC